MNLLYLLHEWTYLKPFCPFPHKTIKYALLKGYSEEEVYVEQPQGYEVSVQEHKWYSLENVLYGLKQDPRAWYYWIDSYLTENGFQRSESEPTMYTKVNKQGNMLIFFLYVYDFIFTDDFGIKEFRSVMESEFEMTNLGLMKFLWALKSNSLKVVYIIVEVCKCSFKKVQYV